jgi:hypothetical protein
MNKVWKVIGLVGLLALVFGVTGVVLAQTDSPQANENPGYGPGMMGGRGRNGSGLSYGDTGPYHDVMMEFFAKELGLTVSQIESRLEAGETMWEIFESEGATWDEFIAIMKNARSAKLELAVADGTITQEQADFMSTRGWARGFGQGYGSCVAGGTDQPLGYHRGPQGRWNTP